MRNEDTMRLLAALGGLFALIEAILGFEQRRIEDINIISIVIGIILAVLVLISVISPDKPIPLNWMVFVVLGIAMIVYSSLIGGILVLIAGFVGYTEGRY
jgi:peptidoglycan/LPS O-acetylase OafA/YrhL